MTQFRDVVARMAVDPEFARHARSRPDEVARQYGLTAEEADRLRGLADAQSGTGPMALGARLSKSGIGTGGLAAAIGGLAPGGETAIHDVENPIVKVGFNPQPDPPGSETSLGGPDTKGADPGGQPPPEGDKPALSGEPLFLIKQGGGNDDGPLVATLQEPEPLVATLVEPPVQELEVQEPPVQELEVQEPPVQELELQEPPVQEMEIVEPPVQEMEIVEPAVPPMDPSVYPTGEVVVEPPTTQNPGYLDQLGPLLMPEDGKPPYLDKVIEIPGLDDYLADPPKAPGDAEDAPPPDPGEETGEQTAQAPQPDPPPDPQGQLDPQPEPQTAPPDPLQDAAWPGPTAQDASVATFGVSDQAQSLLPPAAQNPDDGDGIGAPELAIGGVGLLAGAAIGGVVGGAVSKAVAEKSTADKAPDGPEPATDT